MTLSKYWPLFVSTLMWSSSFIKSGTLTFAPVSSTAGFNALVAVLPFSPGSVDLTFKVAF